MSFPGGGNNNGRPRRRSAERDISSGPDGHTRKKRRLNNDETSSPRHADVGDPMSIDRYPLVTPNPSLSPHRMPEEKGLPALKKHDLSNEYERVVQLSTAGHSGFNAGVFLVRRRRDQLKCIEKSMRPGDVAQYWHRREAGMLRRLQRHPNIVRFLDAWELPRAQPPAASVYMAEYALGTLRSFMLHQYNVCRAHAPHFPEAFLWHVLRSLARALVFLQTGAVHDDDAVPQPGWRPVLHRDIKPENILFRPTLALPPLPPPPPLPPGAPKRVYDPSTLASATAEDIDGVGGGGGLPRPSYWDVPPAPPGAWPYPQVALADFGHAIFRPADAASARMGATEYYRRPPEVPAQDLDGRTDVWFVGSCVKMLARLQLEYALPPNFTPSSDQDPAGRSYSPELNTAIRWAMELDVRRRPNPLQLLSIVNRCFDRAQPRWDMIPVRCSICRLLGR